MHKSQILGPAVNHLRRMASAGSSPADIEAFLEARAFGSTWSPFEYLDRAFLQNKLFLYRMAADRGRMHRAWAKLIEEHSDQWQNDRAPELMRPRDYFAFLQFAQQEEVVVAVCGANPAAGQWIGRPEVRCYEGSLPIPSRRAPPNEGLLAADPNDLALLETLPGYQPPQSYDGFVERLRKEGLSVASADTGHLVLDHQGHRLHESYRLHGVYDASEHEPAWTSRRGEKLRAGLNRHLGAELVRWGPHDDWEFRNDRGVAGPLSGPHLPVIVFGREQGIDEGLTAGDLTGVSPYRTHWKTLYPHHPIEAEE